MSALGKGLATVGIWFSVAAVAYFWSLLAKASVVNNEYAALPVVVGFVCALFATVAVWKGLNL